MRANSIIVSSLDCPATSQNSKLHEISKNEGEPEDKT